MTLELPRTLGKYALVRELGRGGMGIVYEGLDAKLDRRVAIKVLPTDIGDDPVFLKRFLREAKAAARLNHANIVTLHDFDRVEDLHYIVMEYVEGEDLSRRLRREGRLPAPVALRLVAQAARALAEAHRHGIVHRDVKPHNLMILPGDRVKLMDFGVAFMNEDAASRLTDGAHSPGTPAYMSPEQVEGRPADARSDLFSLGVVLFHALAGRLPYERGNLAALARQIARDPLPDPREEVPSIPAEAVAFLRRMTAKHPDERPARADDVAEELERLALLEPDDSDGSFEAPTTPLVPAAARPSTTPIPEDDTASEISVRPDGSGRFRRIADALEAAPLHAIVSLRPGTFLESVVVRRAVTLVAPPGTRVEGDGGPAIRIETVDPVSIRGLGIRGPRRGESGAALVVEAGRPQIVDCAVDAPDGDGVSIKGGGTRPTIRDCAIGPCKGAGVSLAAGAGARIERCRIEGSRTGLLVAGLAADAAGAESGFPEGDDPPENDLLVEETRIRENFLGVAAWGRGTARLAGCEVAENRGSGVAAAGGGRVSLEACAVQGNGGVALQAEESGRIEASACDLQFNARGWRRKDGKSEIVARDCRF